MLTGPVRDDLTTLLVVALAAVWWWAAAAKLRRPPALDRVSEVVPWLVRLPAPLARVGLRALPFLEVALGLALLPAATRRPAAVAGAVVLLAFGLALGAALVRASLVESVESVEGSASGAVAAVAACGCFGGRTVRASQPAPVAAGPAAPVGVGVGVVVGAGVVVSGAAASDLHLAGWHVARPLLLAAAALVVLVPCG